MCLNYELCLFPSDILMDKLYLNVTMELLKRQSMCMLKGILKLLKGSLFFFTKPIDRKLLHTRGLSVKGISPQISQEL